MNNLIAWIVLGGLAGWVASMITDSSGGLLKNIILGIVGALVGGFLMNLIGQPATTGFNFYSFAVAVLGAVVLIFLGRFLTSNSGQ